VPKMTHAKALFHSPNMPQVVQIIRRQSVLRFNGGAVAQA